MSQMASGSGGNGCWINGRYENKVKIIIIKRKKK